MIVPCWFGAPSSSRKTLVKHLSLGVLGKVSGRFDDGQGHGDRRDGVNPDDARPNHDQCRVGNNDQRAAFTLSKVKALSMVIISPNYCRMP
jgi:hypothetical protein